MIQAKSNGGVAAGAIAQHVREHRAMGLGRYGPRRWGVMTPAGRAPSGLGAWFVPWDWSVMSPAACAPGGLGAVRASWDELLGPGYDPVKGLPAFEAPTAIDVGGLYRGQTTPIAVGDPRNPLTFLSTDILRTAGIMPRPGDGLMDWLRENQNVVLIVGGSLLGLALLKK